MPRLMIRLVAFTLLLACCTPTYAASLVLRDSIGPDSSLTDGLGGGVIDSSNWYTWGMAGLVVDASEDGILTELQIVLFGRYWGLAPINNAADILGFTLRFHLWSDGVDGGPDSFKDNAWWVQAALEPGHVEVVVNCDTSLTTCNVENLVTVEEFGATGPPQDPDQLTTYLATVDLSELGIEVQAGRQYVVGLAHSSSSFSGNGLYLRVIGSRATGFEDMYQECGRTSDPYCDQGMPPEEDRPGYLASQLNNTDFMQYAAKLTLGNGDFDGDDDVDGHDFLVWQRNFSGSVTPDQDANGDGIADEKDLNVWQASYGQSWAGALSANVTVPEPSAMTFFLLAMLGLLNHRSVTAGTAHGLFRPMRVLKLRYGQKEKT